MTQDLSDLKLTDLQRSVLKRAEAASGRACTYWMSHTPMVPSTRQTYDACRQLERKGLMSCDRGGYWPLWSITPAGRAALQALGGSDEQAE